MATDKLTVHLPDDIMTEILLRLPVSSLILIKSVCKHWHRLIKNPDFIHLHDKHGVKDSNAVLLVTHAINLKEWIVTTLLSNIQEALPDYDDVALDIIFPSRAAPDDQIHLMGPCNGLFCITNMITVVVFNPATRQRRNVYFPSSSPQNTSTRQNHRSIYCFASVGFGYDTVSNDNMVVWFNGYYNSLDFHYKVEIYSLGTNSWRELDGVFSVVAVLDIWRRHDQNIFVNNAFHWLCAYSILVFDLNKETFKWFKLPARAHVKCDLLVLNESLAFFEYRCFSSVDISIGFDIWVMTEYGVVNSWWKVYNISLDKGIREPLSFSKEGELFAVNKNWDLVSLNLKTSAIKVVFQGHVQKIKNSCFQNSPCLLHAFQYGESFVSLK